MAITASVLVACMGLLVSCDQDALFGEGGDYDVAVTTPAGIQSGDVTVVYTLTGDDGETSDLSIEYTTDGSIYRKATQGVGGDGVQDLTVSSGGQVHTYVWSSDDDLPGERNADVRLRLIPQAGTSDTTGSVQVHNAEFAGAIENETIGRLRLFRLDVNDGEVTSKGSTLTGGTQPHDVIYECGYFLVVHRTSNDVAVLALDEDAETVAPVTGSPFSVDGIGARFLASNGSQVFVSNFDSQTLSIFNLAADGTLALSVHSNVAATGCRGLIERSGKLYVADSTNDRIHVFDVASDGELFTNPASPVTGGGLDAPEFFVRIGSFIYAANQDASTVSGFLVSFGGGLSVISGSPFGLSGGSLIRMAVSGSQVYGVDGAGERLTSLTAGGGGALTEDASSPYTLRGDAFGVVARADVVTVVLEDVEELETFVRGTTGTLSPAAGSPTSAQGAVLRVAVSDCE